MCGYANLLVPSGSIKLLTQTLLVSQSNAEVCHVFQVSRSTLFVAQLTDEEFYYTL